MAYTIGHISGCHLNPAVTLGLTAGGRFKSADVVPYIASQVVGAILGAGVLYVIASGSVDFKLAAKVKRRSSVVTIGSERRRAVASGRSTRVRKW